MLLKKNILTQINPKKIYNKNINGSMYCQLITKYSDAINNNVVPNIDSTFTYICEQEANKYLAQGVQQYQEQIQEIEYRFPLDKTELKAILNKIEENVIQNFQKKAIVYDQDFKKNKQFKELLKQIEYTNKLVREENAKESKRVFEQYIMTEFQMIDQQLKRNNFKNFKEYISDLQHFYNFFLENGPKVDNRELMISEFLRKNCFEVGVIFSQKFEKEISTQKDLLKDNEERNKNWKKDFENHDKKKEEQYLLKYSQLNEKIAELEAEIDQQRQQIFQLQSENQNIAFQNDQSKLQQLEAMNQQIQNLQTKLSNKDNDVKEIERDFLYKQSEFDKTEALLQQQVDFYQNQLEEIKKQSQSTQQINESINKEHQNEIKKISQSFESEIRKLNEVVRNLNDDKHEMQIKYNNIEQELENQINSEQFGNQRLKKEIIELTGQISQFTHENSVLLEYKDMHLNQNDILEDAQEYKERYITIQSEFKKLEENSFNLKTKLEKEKAILEQQLNMCEQQVKEMKSQQEDDKRTIEAIMKAFETSKSENNNQQVIIQLKQEHQIELKNINQVTEQAKIRLNENIQNLTNQINDMELFIKLTQDNNNNQLQQQLEEIQQLKESNINYQEMVHLSEQNQSKLEIENGYQQQIAKYKVQMEEMRLRHLKENQENQYKNEEQLSSLKNMYILEKEGLENRLREEKDRQDKKINGIVEDIEEKYKIDIAQLQDDIENYRDELNDRESQMNVMVQQYDNDISSKQQNNEKLQQQINETKEMLVQAQNQNNSSLEQHIQNFNQERKIFQEKQEKLEKQIQNLQKDKIEVESKRDYLSQQIIQKEKLTEMQLREQKQQDNQIQTQAQSYKQQCEQIQDQFLQFKIKAAKEIALSEQKNQFIEQKAQELQQQLDNSFKRFEERLQQQKQDLSQDYSNKFCKIQEEKQTIEVKYEKNKKNLKEIESIYNKQLAQIEKEKVVLQEKVTNYEQKISDNDGKIIQQNKQLTIQLQQTKEIAQKERKEFRSDSENYKAQIYQLEQEKSEIETNYERDKALFEGKFAFLENQKEQAKNDLVDALKKFEQTLSHVQKARNGEKTEHDSNLNELMLTLENKYQNQINEITENNNRQIQEFEDKIKRLNKEIIHLKEKQALDMQGKSMNFLNEKKLQDAFEKEKHYQMELQKYREQMNDQRIEFQRQFEKERELYQLRIEELEDRYKQSEYKRNTNLFEFEKEKARWNLDKDQYIRKFEGGEEYIQKLDKQQNSLIRENEKLKNDQRISVNVRKSQFANNRTNLQNRFQDPQFFGDLTNVSYDVNSNSDFNQFYSNENNSKY